MKIDEVFLNKFLPPKIQAREIALITFSYLFPEELLRIDVEINKLMELKRDEWPKSLKDNETKLAVLKAIIDDELLWKKKLAAHFPEQCKKENKIYETLSEPSSQFWKETFQRVYLGASNKIPTDLLLIISAYNEKDFDTLRTLLSSLQAPEVHLKHAIGIASREGYIDRVESLVSLYKKQFDIAIINEIIEPTQGNLAIHLAAEAGHTEVVEKLIFLGANPNVVNTHGASAVYLAVEGGHAETILKLAAYGADVNSPTNFGSTPLYRAAQLGYSDCISALFQSGVINHPAPNGWFPIHIATSHQHVAAIQTLVELAIQINSLTNDGLSTTHIAAMHGKAPVFDKLVELQANFMLRTPTGHLPLHFAVAYERTKEILDKLLEIDPNSIDEVDLENKTPLFSAAENGLTAAVSYLAAKGANVNALNGEGKSPLFIAVENNHTSTVKKLLEVGADKTFTFDEESLLLCAVRKGNVESIELLLEDFFKNENLNHWHPLQNAVSYDQIKSFEKLLELGFELKDDTISRLSLLHIAAQENSFMTLELLLSHEPNINQTDPEGKTPLFYAALTGNAEMVGRLIDLGADPNIPDVRGITPLMIAANLEKLDVVEKLLEKKALINQADKAGNTALFIAAKQGFPQIVDLLLKYDANYKLGPKKFNALGVAALMGKEDVIQVFINHEIDINLTFSESQKTPLIAVLQANHTALALKLIENGADVNLADKGGLTPIRVAIEKCNHEVFLKLINECKTNIEEVSAKGFHLIHSAVGIGNTVAIKELNKHQTIIDKKTNLGWLPIHISAQVGNIEVMKLLLSFGADLNAPTPNQWLPCHIAAQFGHHEYIAALREMGCELTIPNGEGFLPIHIAATHGKIEVIKKLGDQINCFDPRGGTALHIILDNEDVAQVQHVEELIKLGADVNEKTADLGWLPTHLAARLQNAEIVRTLINHGSKINELDKNRMTPIDIATVCGNFETFKVLESLGARVHYPLLRELAIKNNHQELVEYISSKIETPQRPALFKRQHPSKQDETPDKKHCP